MGDEVDFWDTVRMWKQAIDAIQSGEKKPGPFTEDQIKSVFETVYRDGGYLRERA